MAEYGVQMMIDLVSLAPLALSICPAVDVPFEECLHWRRRLVLKENREQRERLRKTVRIAPIMGTARKQPVNIGAPTALSKQPASVSGLGLWK